MFVGIMKVFIL